MSNERRFKLFLLCLIGIWTINVIVVMISIMNIINRREPTQDDGLHSVLITREDNTDEAPGKVAIYPEPNPE